MAINEEPLFGSDETSDESDAKINDANDKNQTKSEVASIETLRAELKELNRRKEEFNSKKKADLPQNDDESLKNFSQANIPPQNNISNDQNSTENRLVPLTPQKPSSIRPVDERDELATTQRKKTPLWKMWQLWGILLVLCSGGVGYGATTMLLQLPKTQSCSKVFWPVASASIRLYCAQTAAEEKNVDGLLAAIDLVAVLPEDHPLRPEINRNIDRWATGILAIGESEFQTGKLEQADRNS